MKLTQEDVESYPARNNWISDGNGLLLRTSANGKRAWYWSRRVAGRNKRTRIGDAAVMTLAEARAFVLRGGESQDTHAKLRATEAELVAANARLDEVRSERDRLWQANVVLTAQFNSMVDKLRDLGLRPVDTRKVRSDGRVDVVAEPDYVERIAVPLADLAERWFELHAAEWSKGTRKAYRSRLNVHVLPRFGERSMDGITTREIADFLNGYENAGTRNFLGIILRGVFGLAIAEGSMTTNPAEAAKALVRNGGNGTKHREALPVEDVPAFFASLGDSRAEQALKLVMLTAVRIGAVAGGSEAEVDGDVWTPNPARFGKGKVPPRVPLPAVAAACLDGLGVYSDTIRAVIGGRSFTVHGFRAAFRSWCQRAENADISFEAKETALGHTVGTAVQRAYERDDWLDERRVLMQRWADFCAAKA